MRKLCPDCGLRKPLTEFALQPSKPDGHASICKPCKRAYDRARYQNIKAMEVKRVMKWQKAHWSHVLETQNARRIKCRQQ